MIYIALKRGRVALLDDEFAYLDDGTWYAVNERHSWYAVRQKDGKKERMHRIVMSAPSGVLVDHINHNGLDNRRHNLRLCNHSINALNARKRDGTSRYKGVSWSKTRKKWQAFVTVNGKQVFLGRFATELEAHQARERYT